MSNVIKSQNVTRLSDPRIIGNQASGYITLQIPLYDIDGDLEKKRRKMLDECDEFLAEISASEINNQDALAEMFDVIQTMAHYIHKFTKDHIISGEGSADYVETVFKNANDRHLLKLENYAEQRGWKVIAGGGTT